MAGRLRSSVRALIKTTHHGAVCY